GLRKFRVGGGLTFDFFPNTSEQPGVGIATEALYQRIGTAGTTLGRFDITAAPYVTKAFNSNVGVFTPYLAFPFGIGFRSGGSDGLATLALGTLFRHGSNQNLSYIAELDIDISNSFTTIS